MDRQPIPVLCDLCRAQGEAGEDPFADLADLLDFQPIEVRSHANNWTPEHQRAFIAALAVTGNVRPAARAVGRYANGAERLRRAPRGKSFAAAWDNALDLYRERELAILKGNLAELDAEHRKASANAHQVARELDYHRIPDEPGGLPDPQDIEDARERIASRLEAARALYLLTIVDDPDKRAAWELLCGPTDWDAVEAGHIARRGPPRLREPEWVVTAANIDLLAPSLLPEEVTEALAREAPTMSPPEIEHAQARAMIQEAGVRDYREGISDGELRKRGFEYRGGEVWVKRL